METRSISISRPRGTPKRRNASSITSSDYDGIPNDCYKWTGQDQAQFGQNGNTATITTTAGVNATTVNYTGQSTNPLQSPSVGAIRWNVSVTVNKTTGWSTHVFVSGAVSCYPSHQIVVNNVPVASFAAPIDPGITYITNCLVFNGPSTPLSGAATTTNGASVPDL
jgi:hypothetical protein